MPKEIKKPNAADAERCFRLKCDAKQGRRLHPDDQSFVEKMYSKYPEWYKSIELDVFKATKPFGAKSIGDE